jgi:hypothetical protein
MDLREIQKYNARHPWEIARVQTLIKILKNWLINRSNIKVLDIGCGDAFISGQLQNSFALDRYDGLDTYLSDSQITQLSRTENNIILHNNFNKLRIEYYNLILFLDVIEHVEDDYVFLNDIVNKYATSGAFILITAPAFNFLFSSHDRFLGHFRRYNLKQFNVLIHSLRFECLSSGYLFLSILPVRLLSVGFERFFPSKFFRKRGAGNWKRGTIITKILTFFLTIDNRISLGFNKIGINLPGLTVWAICRKQRS